MSYNGKKSFEQLRVSERALWSIFLRDPDYTEQAREIVRGFDILTNDSIEQVIDQLIYHDVGRIALFRISEDSDSRIIKSQASSIRGLRDKAIGANLGLVGSLAGRFVNEYHQFEDAYASGISGLITAVDRFLPELGNSFTTYAVFWIRHTIYRSFDNSSSIIRIPVHVRHDLLRVRRLEERRSGGASTLSSHDVSHALSAPLDRIRFVQQIRIGVLNMVDLDAKAYDSDDSYSVADTVVDFDTCTHEEAESREVAEKLHEILDSLDLSHRERYILARRYGLDGMEPNTLSEIGSHLGITRERVRQLELKCLIKLRGKLKGFGDAYGQDNTGYSKVRGRSRRRMSI